MTRRVVLATVLLVYTLLPAPAYAWLGWLDELSGPKLWGFQFDARVMCFGADPAVNRTLAKTNIRDLATNIRTRAALQPWLFQDQGPMLQLVTPAEIEQFIVAASGPVAEPIPEGRRSTRFSAAAAATGRTPGLEETALDLNAIKANLDVLRGVPLGADSKAMLFPGAAGARVSLCKARRDKTRQMSLDVSSRFYFQGDEDSPTTTTLAGGNTIRFTTVTSTVSYRLLYGLGNEFMDIADVGGGGGVYWFGSDQEKPGAIKSFHGVELEARVEFHLPPALVKQNGWWKAVPQFRLSRLYFPAGFDAGAFGSVAGSPAIGPEGAWERALFWDLGVFAR